MTTRLTGQSRLIGKVGTRVVVINRDDTGFDPRWHIVYSEDDGFSFGAPTYFDVCPFATGAEVFTEALDPGRALVFTAERRADNTNAAWLTDSTFGTTSVPLIYDGLPLEVYAATYDPAQDKITALALRDGSFGFFTLADGGTTWAFESNLIPALETNIAGNITRTSSLVLQKVSGYWFIIDIGSGRVYRGAGLSSQFAQVVVETAVRQNAAPFGELIKAASVNNGSMFVPALVLGYRVSFDFGANWTFYNFDDYGTWLNTFVMGTQPLVAVGLGYTSPGVRLWIADAVTGYAGTIAGVDPFHNRSYITVMHAGPNMLVMHGTKDNRTDPVTTYQHRISVFDYDVWSSAAGLYQPAHNEPYLELERVSGGVTFSPGSPTVVNLVFNIRSTEYMFTPDVVSAGRISLVGFPATLTASYTRLNDWVVQVALVGATTETVTATLSAALSSATGQAIYSAYGAPDSAAIPSTQYDLVLDPALLDFELLSFSSAVQYGGTAELGVVLDMEALLEALALHTSAEVVTVVDANLQSSLILTGTAVMTAELYILWAEVLGVRDSTPALDQLVAGRRVSQRHVIAVNLETGAVTRYENYDFDRFEREDGKVYGVRADGRYLLEGATDAGEPIDASFSLGKERFGSEQVKTLSAVYLSGSSEQPLKVRVRSQLGTHTFTADAAAATERMQRVKTGRGLRSQFFGIEVYNQNGADFEVDLVDHNVSEGGRRV